MIYIISETSDLTTDIVCEYLLGQNIAFKRINYQSNYSFSFSISKNDNATEVINQKITAQDTLWIRRGRIAFTPRNLISSTSNDVAIIKRYLGNEEDALNKSVEQFLYSFTKVSGSYIKENENYKISNLLLAQQCGLLVPETLVTSNKKRALDFLKKHKAIITKDLRKPVNLNLENTFLTSVGTFAVSETDFDTLDEEFFPIFLQEQIEKTIELRIFYFHSKLYSMAIFSQRDERTKLDFRNYDRDRPLRSVPFLLPETISEKVIHFMKTLDLNTGSIDFIVNPEGEYIFLEVNPQGQIDWLSKNCNYYIEKDIAKHLIHPYES